MVGRDAISLGRTHSSAIDSFTAELVRPDETVVGRGPSGLHLVECFVGAGAPEGCLGLRSESSAALRCKAFRLGLAQAGAVRARGGTWPTWRTGSETEELGTRLNGSAYSAGMHERPFRADYSADDHSLTVSGSVDEMAADGLRSVVLAGIQLAPDRELIIDLTDVDFLPSLALGVLVGARKRGHRVRLHADEGTVAFRVLTLTGLLGTPDQQAPVV